MTGDAPAEPGKRTGGVKCFLTWEGGKGRVEDQSLGSAPGCAWALGTHQVGASAKMWA